MALGKNEAVILLHHVVMQGDQCIQAGKVATHMARPGLEVHLQQARAGLGSHTAYFTTPEQLAAPPRLQA